jgi:hypothetical protein
MKIPTVCSGSTSPKELGCGGAGRERQAGHSPAPTSIDNDALTAWLIEAAVRYAGKPVSVPSLQSLPVLFPFNLTRPLAYVVPNSPHLDFRSEGPSNQFVALHATL